MGSGPTMEAAIHDMLRRRAGAATSGAIAARARPVATRGRAEAFDWLTSNKNEYSFAAWHKSRAVEYVKELYARGAKRVLVTGIRERHPWRLKNEGPHASALLVYPPTSRMRKVIESMPSSPDTLPVPNKISASGASLRLSWRD